MAALRRALDGAGLDHSLRYAAMYATDTSVDEVDFPRRGARPHPGSSSGTCSATKLLRQACLDMDGLVVRRSGNARQRRRPPGTRCSCATPNRCSSPASPWAGWSRRAWSATGPRPRSGWLATASPTTTCSCSTTPTVPPGAGWEPTAPFKADVYRRSGASLFLESSVRQAIEIAELSRREVVCTDTMQLIRPGHRPVSRGSAAAPQILACPHPGGEESAQPPGPGASEGHRRASLSDGHVPTLRG